MGKKKEEELFSLDKPNQEVITGDVGRYVRLCKNNMNLPPLDISDPKAVEKRIDEYLENCIITNVKPTYVGLCNVLGIDRSTLFRWEQGDRREGSHKDIAVKYKKLLNELWEIEMQEGKINPVVGIFLGKNNFGYKDQQEKVIATRNPFIAYDELTEKEKEEEIKRIKANIEEAQKIAEFDEEQSKKNNQ